MKIAGVIPTHNHRQWVLAALESMALQPVCGVVVVDDGSSDGTAEYLRPHLGRLEGAHGIPFLFHRHESPRGPAAARNAGAALANRWGPEAYAFLDSDDFYAPDKVRASAAVLARHGRSVGVVYSDYVTFNPDEPGLTHPQYKRSFDQALLLRECIINCDSVVAREAFEFAGGFPEELRVCEDYCLWLKITRKYLAHHIAMPLVTIRVGRHSSSATVPTPAWNECYARAFRLAGYTA